MANMEKVWHGTRRYMMSGRTNPPPAQFAADLKKQKLTPKEQQALVDKVKAWKGGNPSVRNATVKDIQGKKKK